MDALLKVISDVNSFVNNIVWGWPALILLGCVGILMTFLTKFFQVSHIGHWMKHTIGAIFSDKDVTGHTKDKSISQFQSLCTALAATVGTGNIVGVSGAIITGGPGAVFWMWVIAFFGMMTNYSENVLGIFYRRKNSKQEWAGGAMYYLRDGLGAKKNCKVIGAVLAVLFSVFCLLASFGIGNMTQVNSISGNMETVFGIPTWITGIVILLLVGLVVVGGLKRIAAVTEKIVPFMVVIYIIGTVVIFFLNIGQAGAVFAAIFKSAFGFQAAAGGVVGYGIKLAIEQGMKRGVFSNEAGLGSSVMVHSSSNVKEPVRQGMWGIFEVFADTIVVCTLTAFTVLSSGLVDLGQGESATFLYQPENASVYVMEEYMEAISGGSETAPAWTANYSEADGYEITYYAVELKDGKKEFAIVSKEKEDDLYLDKESGESVSETFNGDSLLKLSKANMVSTVFSLHFGKIGSAFIAIAIMLFAFSTVLGWSHYGSTACAYLIGEKATIVYKVIFVLLVFGGAVMTDNLAWDLADTFNGLMMIPNLIGVLVLSPIVMKITSNYVARHIKKEDVEPMLSAFPEIQAEAAEAVKKGAE